MKWRLAADPANTLRLPVPSPLGKGVLVFPTVDGKVPDYVLLNGRMGYAFSGRWDGWA